MPNPPCVADIVQPLAVDDWVSEPGRHQDTSRRQARRYLLAEPSHRYDGVNGSTLRRRPRPLNLRFLSGVLRTRIDGQSSHPHYFGLQNTSIVTRSASATDRSCGRVAVNIGLDTFARIPTRREELMAGPKAHLLE